MSKFTVEFDTDDETVVQFVDTYNHGGRTKSSRVARIIAAAMPKPRQDEPTGLGAVVEALPFVGDRTRRIFIKVNGFYEDDDGFYTREWDELIDPVVLHPGWDGTR